MSGHNSSLIMTTPASCAYRMVHHKKWSVPSDFLKGLSRWLLGVFCVPMDHLLANNPFADDICKKSLEDGVSFIMTSPGPRKKPSCY